MPAGNGDNDSAGRGGSPGAGGGATSGNGGEGSGSNDFAGGYYADTIKSLEDRILKLTKESQPQKQAAAAIQRGLTQAGEEITASTETARADLQPYASAGVNALQQVAPLINDPNAQADFIQNNPFFDALAEDAQRRIFNTGAASGRGFSGGTAQALQNSIMLLGDDLLNSQVNRGMGLAGLGGNAAGAQAGFTQQAGLTLGDLAASGGETEAAGILGLENTRRADKAAKRQSQSNLLGTVGTIAALSLSDRRFKENITPIFKTGETQWYSFKYIDGPWAVGVMADEVPYAVTEVDGVKYVDYSKVRKH